jgi:hypothetical protein
MAGSNDVRWLVGTVRELGALEEQVADAAATIRETWPAGANARIVALVAAEPDAADDVAGALEPGVQRFDDEAAARDAAASLAGNR